MTDYLRRCTSCARGNQRARLSTATGIRRPATRSEQSGLDQQMTYGAHTVELRVLGMCVGSVVRVGGRWVMLHRLVAFSAGIALNVSRFQTCTLVSLTRSITCPTIARADGGSE